MLWLPNIYIGAKRHDPSYIRHKLIGCWLVAVVIISWYRQVDITAARIHSVDRSNDWWMTTIIYYDCDYCSYSHIVPCPLFVVSLLRLLDFCYTRDSASVQQVNDDAERQNAAETQASSHRRRTARRCCWLLCLGVSCISGFGTSVCSCRSWRNCWSRLGRARFAHGGNDCQKCQQ
jgi:hypothetical protein